MTLVIGKGELVSSALEFLGQRGPGKTLTMRTSAIRATWNIAGRVEAERTDVRIGGKLSRSVCQTRLYRCDLGVMICGI